MSRLSDFLAGLDSEAPGWNKDRWLASLADTKTCRDSILSVKNPIDRMIGFIKCRRGKRLPVKSA